jgi:hypothetical protein
MPVMYDDDCSTGQRSRGVVCYRQPDYGKAREGLWRSGVSCPYAGVDFASDARSD